MELANVMLALNGKRGNTVPRYGVTPAEVLVLLQLHGPEAVYDIDVLDEDASMTEEQQEVAEMNGRTLRAHLLQTYPKMQERLSVVPTLFPSPSGRDIPEQFSELDLPDTFFKAMARKLPPPVKSKEKAAGRKRDRADRQTEEEQRLAADELLDG